MRESNFRPVRETIRPGFTSSTSAPLFPLAGKRKSAFASKPLASPNTGFQPENGRVTVTNGISLGPLSSTLVCPSGQTFVLACVKYTNIVLTDTTNNVSANIADTSRTFVNITGCPIP